MVTALVLSGGSGARMGMDIPKQYIKVNGRTVIAYCLETLFSHEEIDAVQVVADKMWHEAIIEAVEVMEKFRGFSKPGNTRQLSILNGLEDIMSYASASDYVLVHDAARPFVSHALITDCINAVKGHDGVLPVLPMKDTVYLSEDGMRISSLLERSKVYAGQAPELFVLGKYYAANRQLCPNKIRNINGSSEPAVMAGMDVAMIPGDERNFKITTRENLDRFVEIIKQKKNTLDIP